MFKVGDKVTTCLAFSLLLDFDDPKCCTLSNCTNTSPSCKTIYIIHEITNNSVTIRNENGELFIPLPKCNNPYFHISWLKLYTNKLKFNYNKKTRLSLIDL